MLDLNNTTVSQADKGRECGSLWLALMRDVGFAGVALLGLSLNSAITKYLNNKPLGQQSILDVPYTFLFNTVKINILIWLPFVITINHSDVVGHVIATLLMWPSYDAGTIFIILIGVCPTIQAILVYNDSIELPFSDKAFKLSLWIGIWLPFLLMNLICSLCGVYPPVYDSLRKLPPKNIGFDLFRAIVSSISISVFILIRLVLCCKHREEKSKSNQLLNNKVMILTSVFIFLSFLSFLIFKVDGPTMWSVNCAIVFISLPTSVILSHSNLISHSSIQSFYGVRILKLLKKSTKSKSSTNPSSESSQQQSAHFSRSRPANPEIFVVNVTPGCNAVM